MSETITIQFRVPKEFVTEFNEFIKATPYATHNKVVKQLTVNWLTKRRAKAAPKPVQVMSKQESSLEEMVDDWNE